MAAPEQQFDACPDGEHDPVWDPKAGETVCQRCKLSGDKIVNLLGHDLY